MVYSAFFISLIHLAGRGVKLEDCKVGIDRIICKDLEIKQVNIELLRSKGFIVIQDEKCIRILKDDEGKDAYISYIRVSKEQDNTLLINDLKIGRLKKETNIFNGMVDYEHLNINLPKGISKTRTNENNISNTDDLMQSIKAVQDELEGLGFGMVNILNTELKEIEINVNVDLKKPFKEYEKVLSYLQDLLPKRLKSEVNNNHKPKDRYTGFQSGNKSINIKMYDKRANIWKKTGQEIGKERLRIEYSLLNEQKIKDVFGSNKLNEIVADEFELIDKAFKRLLQADLLNNLYKDIDKQLKHATKEIGRYKATKTKLSGQEYIFDNDILDIEIVLGALKENTLSNHYSRECKTLISRVLEGKQVKLFGNIEKLNEILEVLGQEKVDIKTTRNIKKLVNKYH